MNKCATITNQRGARRFFVLLGFFTLVQWGQAQEFNKTELTRKLEKLPVKKQITFLDSLTDTYKQTDPVKAIPYFNFAVDYAWKHKFEDKKIATFLYRRGSMSRKVSNYPQAFSDFNRVEKIYQEIKDDDGLQHTYGAFSALYANIGDNKKALTFARKSIDYAQRTKNQDGKAVSYNTMAVVYFDMGYYDSALHAYRKAYEIYRKKPEAIYQQALVLDNIALTFVSLNHLDSAIHYNKQALLLAYKKNDPFLILQILVNAISVDEKTKEYDRLYAHAQQAKSISDSLDISFYEVISDFNMANALLYRKQYQKALQQLKGLPDRARQEQHLELEEAIYNTLYKTYDALQMPDSALWYFKKEMVLSDSIRKINDASQTEELMARYSLEEKEKSIQLLKVQKASEQENSRLKSVIIWVASGLMLVVLLLLFLVLKRFSENKQLNKLLKESNNQVIAKNQVLAQKQQEITDSINYAKRIQYSLLAHTNLLKQNVPDHFILFKPKDIVSGDFYWATRHNQDFYLAVCDCTGHGVPGAFMSLLNISFLNEAINEKGILQPHEVLNHVRERLIENMEDVQDGMDAVLLRFTEGRIDYAAAHNAPWILRDNEIIELQGDKMPVGKGISHSSFTLQTVTLQPNDILICLTDGFADQFGGPKGKKYKYKNLKKLIIRHSRQNLLNLGNLLENELSAWQGDLEQTDDICVMGIRI